MDLMTIKHEKDLCFSVQVRGHKFLVDMPRDARGEDRGASPTDLLAASLGACMGMHMALYCQTVGLPHEGMEMNLVYTLVEESGRKRIESVTVDVLSFLKTQGRGARRSYGQGRTALSGIPWRRGLGSMWRLLPNKVRSNLVRSSE
jgi:uncharacterized OsmC-like protein